MRLLEVWGEPETWGSTCHSWNNQGWRFQRTFGVFVLSVREKHGDPESETYRRLSFTQQLKGPFTYHVTQRTSPHTAQPPHNVVVPEHPETMILRVLPTGYPRCIRHKSVEGCFDA